MDENEIIERVRDYLETKHNLTLESIYFLLKAAKAEVWEEIQQQGEEEGEQEEENFEDFGKEEAGEEEEVETLAEELDLDNLDLDNPPKELPDITKPIKPLIKRPKVTVKK